MNLSKIIYNWCFCVQKIGNDIHVVPVNRWYEKMAQCN